VAEVMWASAGATTHQMRKAPAALRETGHPNWWARRGGGSL